jgi:hypothetical protein
MIDFNLAIHIKAILEDKTNIVFNSDALSDKTIHSIMDDIENKLIERASND